MFIPTPDVPGSYSITAHLTGEPMALDVLYALRDLHESRVGPRTVRGTWVQDMGCKLSQNDAKVSNSSLGVLG